MDASSSFKKSSKQNLENVTHPGPSVNEVSLEDSLAQESSSAEVLHASGQGGRAKGQLVRAALLVGVMTLASRILGLIRDIFCARQFGTSWQWDAFIYAFMLPNFLRRIVGEGALTSAFIPVYSETLQKHGKKEAFRFANIVWTLLGTSILGVLCLVEVCLGFLTQMEVFGPRLILTLNLLKILFPYILFLSMYALGMGILNSHRHFFMPSLAPIVLNLFWIGGVLWVAPAFSNLPEAQLKVLALMLLAAGGVQMAMEIPPLYRMGFRLRWIWDWCHRGLRRSGQLILPAVLGFAVMQINILVDMTLGFLIGPGANSSLWYGTRLMQFPIGVFAIAMGTVLLPMISQQTARGEKEKSKKTLSFALRSVFLIILPCSVGLMVLRVPIVQLLFERGEFDAVSTARTASVLLFYAIGLFAYGGQKQIVAGFSALQDTKTPVQIGMIALATNIVLNLILMGPLREGGLALATSVSAILQFILLMVFYQRKNKGLALGELGISLGKILAASVGMGFVCAGVFSGGKHFFTGAGIGSQIGLVSAAILSGVLSYLLFCWILKVPEIKEAWQWAARKPKTRKAA